MFMGRHVVPFSAEKREEGSGKMEVVSKRIACARKNQKKI